jgi:hypothetical protein
MTKHAGDSLGALGQFNHQIPDGLDAFGTNDDLFKNLFVVGVVALAILREVTEQEFVSRFPELSFGAEFLSAGTVLNDRMKCHGKKKNEKVDW